MPLQMAATLFAAWAAGFRLGNAALRDALAAFKSRCDNDLGCDGSSTLLRAAVPAGRTRISRRGQRLRPGRLSSKMDTLAFQTG